jgi:hypothetical protein
MGGQKVEKNKFELRMQILSSQGHKPGTSELLGDEIFPMRKHKLAPRRD